MLLSNAELKNKLNCKQDKPLIAWLKKRNVKWDVDTKGKPIATLDEVERGMSGRIKETEEAEF